MRRWKADRLMLDASYMPNEKEHVDTRADAMGDSIDSRTAPEALPDFTGGPHSMLQALCELVDRWRAKTERRRKDADHMVSIGEHERARSLDARADEGLLCADALAAVLEGHAIAEARSFIAKAGHE